MSNMVSIKACERESKTIGLSEISGVVYGPKQSVVKVLVDRKDFEKAFKQAGEATVVTLEGLKKPMSVLIKAVTFAPVKGGIQHIDFYAVDAKSSVTTHVPLVFLNESPAVKAGAVINKVLHEVTVSCLPKDLPDHFEVDLSRLGAVGDKILLADLVHGEGVKLLQDESEVVVQVEGQLTEATDGDKTAAATDTVTDSTAAPVSE